MKKQRIGLLTKHIIIIIVVIVVIIKNQQIGLLTKHIIIIIVVVVVVVLIIIKSCKAPTLQFKTLDSTNMVEHTITWRQRSSVIDTYRVK